MRKKAVQQGRSKRRGDAYSLPYVEPLSAARTPLADFFSILIGERHLGNPVIVLRFRQPGLRQRQAEQFALAGAVFDQEDGGVCHHIYNGYSAGNVTGSKMNMATI